MEIEAVAPTLIESQCRRTWDAAATPSKNSLGKTDYIWANLVRFELNLDKIKAKFGQKRLDLGKIEVKFVQMFGLNLG